MELLCGPSPRGTAFVSAVDRDRCRRVLGLSVQPAAVDREARMDEARNRDGRERAR